MHLSWSCYENYHIASVARELGALATAGAPAIHLRGLRFALTQGANLIAPHSVHWEIGNAFSAMFKRNRVTLEQALKAIQAYHKIPIRFVEVGLERSLELAKTANIYAYDAYLIRCALRYRAPLMSLDRSLVDFAKRMKVKVVEAR